MRVWDLPVSVLCRQHLLGQHREIHALFNIIVFERKAYQNHPETKRWKGSFIGHLVAKHNETAQEITRRGYQHKTPIDWPLTDHLPFPEGWQSVEEQIRILKQKGCECKV